jgi:hypothetical protein
MIEHAATYLVVLGDFTNETLERQLADQEFGRLLVTTNFTEGNGTRAEAMRLLDTTSSGHGRLAGLLGGELLAGGFTTGRLAGGLLLDGHRVDRSVQKRGYQTSVSIVSSSDDGDDGGRNHHRMTGELPNVEEAWQMACLFDKG